MQIIQWTIEFNEQDGESGWDVFFDNRVVEYALPEEDDALDVVRQRAGSPTTVLIIDEFDGERQVVA